MAYRVKYNSSFGELGAHVAQRWPEKKIISRKGKQHHTLGIALSGGGYRSAIFCYGILQGLYDIKGVLDKTDYISAVSGGSWIATPFSMSDELNWFFDPIPTHANLIEEGFEALLPNPVRVIQEASLSRKDSNYISNIFGRLLAKTFLREHGQASRYKTLADKNMIKDVDRPFLIINGTVNFRSPKLFSVTQECFEMTRLYSGSRSLGYIHSKDLETRKDPDKERRAVKIRDAIAMSGAAVAYHLPALGGEVAGMGLSREVVNYAKNVKSKARVADTDRLDISDGGHYNNLGIESLINRGCGYIIVVDAEHDSEDKDRIKSNQSYHGLRTLLERHHIPNPIGEEKIAELDAVNKPLHIIDGAEGIPDILYIKLKSLVDFDNYAQEKPYNKPGFLRNLFGKGKFSFDPQFSTAKLDYDFTEHRNLSDLGRFIVEKYKNDIKAFVARSH
ncbi:patatin-like phospholipase family protein [bacterium]|nr:patatin-like phospholipase family protein [bacterium]